MKKFIESRPRPVGIITATRHRQTKKLPKLWNKFLRICEKAGIITRGHLEKYYLKGQMVGETTKHNLIANVGLAVDAQIRVGEYMGTGEITHMALGTDTTLVSVADTTLGNEVYRNAVASGTSSGQTAILTAFYTEVEVDGTFREFGNFIDGTGSADTGVLWSHVNVNWTKTDEETLTVQCRYEFANG